MNTIKDDNIDNIKINMLNNLERIINSLDMINNTTITKELKEINNIIKDVEIKCNTLTDEYIKQQELKLYNILNQKFELFYSVYKKTIISDFHDFIREKTQNYYNEFRRMFNIVDINVLNDLLIFIYLFFDTDKYNKLESLYNRLKNDKALGCWLYYTNYFNNNINSLINQSNDEITNDIYEILELIKDKDIIKYDKSLISELEIRFSQIIDELSKGDLLINYLNRLTDYDICSIAHDDYDSINRDSIKRIIILDTFLPNYNEDFMKQIFYDEYDLLDCVNHNRGLYLFKLNEINRFIDKCKFIMKIYMDLHSNIA